MTDKTSEDLVFEKLKTPSLQEMFAEQIFERRKSHPDDFSLYYMCRFESGDFRVLTVQISNMKSLSLDTTLEYRTMSGSMPVFNYKKD